VLSTSQVSVWDALRHVGYGAPVPGYGRLLAKMLPTPLRES
jgi:maleate cis-trans isomerase